MAKQNKNKQEVTNRTFNIGNISKASTNTNLKKSKASEDKKLVPIKFKVHKDLIERFQVLRMDYAKTNKNFALSNNEMFSIMVQFMYLQFQDKNILEKCPDDFKSAIIRPGKRKATSRTVAFPYSDTILFTIEKGIADKYMDIMFSFIRADKDDNIFNSHHSRTYFFYDFIDYVEEHKSALNKFNSD